MLPEEQLNKGLVQPEAKLLGWFSERVEVIDRPVGTLGAEMEVDGS